MKLTKAQTDALIEAAPGRAIPCSTGTGKALEFKGLATRHDGAERKSYSSRHGCMRRVGKDPDHFMLTEAGKAQRLEAILDAHPGIVESLDKAHAVVAGVEVIVGVGDLADLAWSLGLLGVHQIRAYRLTSSGAALVALADNRKGE